MPAGGTGVGPRGPWWPGAWPAARAVAACRLAGGGLSLKRDADIVQHGVLHRDLKAPALAGGAALVEGAQDADRHRHAGARIAERGARLGRRPIRLGGDAPPAAAGL